MSLLNNAVVSLRLALEDYSAHDDERLLSAVRGLHASILLFYKEKLRRLSPPGTNDVLLKANIRVKSVPGGGITAIGVGRKTVEIHQIKERFEDFGVVTHWDRFDRITNLRNEIEHFYTTTNRSAIEAMISDTFLIVRDFISDELAEDPARLLDVEVWSVLLSVSEVIDKETKLCQRALAEVNWESDALAAAIRKLICAECGSPLLMPVGCGKEAGLICRSCGEEVSFEDSAERALSSYFADDNFLAMKEGFDPGLILCPHCRLSTYIMEENRCAVCEETCETECSMCGSSIQAEELGEGSLCGYCDHVLSKDD